MGHARDAQEVVARQVGGVATHVMDHDAPGRSVGIDTGRCGSRSGDSVSTFAIGVGGGIGADGIFGGAVAICIVVDGVAVDCCGIDAGGNFGVAAGAQVDDGYGGIGHDVRLPVWLA